MASLTQAPRRGALAAALAAAALLGGCASAPQPHPSAVAAPRPSARPQPAGYLRQPWRDQLDFGLLVDVRLEPRGVVLVVDREQFLTGRAALDYATENHQTPLRDYVIVNANPRLREFTVLPDAALYGTVALAADTLLGSPDRPERLTPLSLGERASAWLAADDQSPPPDRARGIPVWLRHVGGPDGPIGYLGELWVP